MKLNRNQTVRTIASWILMSLAAVAVSACSSTPKTLKAPCGPTAGMTDPCGDREPINAVTAEGVAQLDISLIVREL